MADPPVAGSTRATGAPRESSGAEALRAAIAAGHWPQAFDELQRLLQDARSRGDRGAEDRWLEELAGCLRASGDPARAALIGHYRRVGFRPPLGYDAPNRSSHP